MLLVILFLLPLPLGANRPWAWSFFEIAIFALSIFTAAKYWQSDKLGIRSYSNAIYIWLLFIAIAGLQIIPMPQSVLAMFASTSLAAYQDVGAQTYYFSVDPVQSKISFVKLLSFFCLFVCVLALINNERRIRLLLLTMMASATFQALYGSLEILLGAEQSLIFNLPVEASATGSFVYKNHFANFLVLGLAAGVGLMVSSLEKSNSQSTRDMLRSLINNILSSKIIVRICIIIMVIALVMSHSRMGNIAFFIAIAVVGGIALVSIKNKSKSLSVFIISMFIVDLFVVSTYFGLERIKTRLAETSFQQETRDEVIRDAYPMVGDFPLLGSGAGTFYSTFPSYQESEVYAFYDHLHNDYLQFLIEYGLIGLAVLTGLICFCVYKALRAMRTRRNSIFKGSAFACLMAFLAMGIQMSVDFPLQAYANACYFVTFLALSMIINSLKLYGPLDKSKSKNDS